MLDDELLQLPEGNSDDLSDHPLILPALCLDGVLQDLYLLYNVLIAYSELHEALGSHSFE